METGITHVVKPGKPEQLDIGAYTGGTKNSDVDDATEIWKTKLLDMISPVCAYHVEKIKSIKDEVITLDSGLELRGARMARELKDCDMAILFVATIGSGPDEEVNTLTAAGELVDAYILDSLASVAADAILRSFAVEMEAHLKEEGRSMTRWFSPGSCEIPLEGQEKIFSAVDASLIGVSLTESFLMVPRKSVSGICGLLPYDSGISVATMNACELCGKKDCFVRNHRKNEAASN